MTMITRPLRTKPSGLYRHWRGLGLYKVGYREKKLHIRSPSLPSTPRRVPSRHGRGSSVFVSSQPVVPAHINRPDARGPLNPGLPQSLPASSIPMSPLSLTTNHHHAPLPFILSPLSRDIISFYTWDYSRMGQSQQVFYKKCILMFHAIHGSC